MANRIDNLGAGNLGEDQKDKKNSWEGREPVKGKQRAGIEREARAEVPDLDLSWPLEFVK